MYECPTEETTGAVPLEKVFRKILTKTPVPGSRLSLQL